MTQQEKNSHYKCPYCPCIFLTKDDLQKHITIFSEHKGQHEYLYKKTHGRLEHGYSDE